MERELVCIGCPLGCQITVKLENAEIISISGNSCKVGENYAREEVVAPKRMITSPMAVKDKKRPACVKTSKAIDKKLINACLYEIKHTKVSPNANIGDVVIKNVCDTDIDIILTKKST